MEGLLLNHQMELTTLTICVIPVPQQTKELMLSNVLTKGPCTDE